MNASHFSFLGQGLESSFVHIMFIFKGVHEFHFAPFAGFG
jgi:hypothetical protein